jgi:hypothetical protein
MRAAVLRGLIGLVAGGLALLVPHAPARAQNCVSSCARGGSVCSMETKASFAACLKGCAVADTKCHLSCMTAARSARSTCQVARSDCMTSCPTPDATPTSCVAGCS